MLHCLLGAYLLEARVRGAEHAQPQFLIVQAEPASRWTDLSTTEERDDKTGGEPMAGSLLFWRPDEGVHPFR